MMQVRTIKALGLGLVAAITAMAVMGVGTASATTKSTALCKVAELVCPEASQYKAGTVIKGQLKTGTKAVLTGSLKVECEESEVSLETTGSSLATSVLAKFLVLIFNKCTTCPKVTPLLAAFGPGHLFNLGGLKGLLLLLTPLVHLEGCFGFAKCTVKAEAVELDADTSVEPATVKAVNEKLSISGFGCGSEGTWNAEYVLTAPTPLYIES
jgi:hypothetical protein